MVKRFFLVFSVLLFSASFCFSQDEVVLRWVDLDAVYRVEISKDGYIFYNSLQNESELTLDLVPGEYEYRITALDPFGGELSRSDWITLSVTRAQVPVFRLPEPVYVPSFSKIDFNVFVEPSYLNPGTEFYLLYKNRRIKGEWIEDEAGGGSVAFHQVRLKAGSWELEAVDPSELTFSQSQAVIAKPMYMPEESLRESQFDLHLGYAPMAGFAMDSDRTALSLWNAEAALLVQAGSQTPFVRSLGLEFRGHLGFAGADPLTENPGILGGADISLFFRSQKGSRITPFFQLGAGVLWSDSDDFFDSKTALLLKSSAGIDINRRRHCYRIGLTGAYGLTDDYEMAILSLFLRWGYQL